MSQAGRVSKGEVISVEKSLEISPSKSQRSSPLGGAPKAMPSTGRSSSGSLKESGFHSPKKGGRDR